MFDISWSELLILGIVTLVFVGPKELPVFLRTIGRYMGMVKRQASEFREQFDTAMREAEFDQIRKDMMAIKTDVEGSISSAETAMRGELNDIGNALDKAAEGRSDDASAAGAHDADAHDADGLPLAPAPPYRPGPDGTIDAAPQLAPAKPAAEAAAGVSAPPPAPDVSKAKAAADAAAEAARTVNPPSPLPSQTAEATKSGV